MQPDAEPIPSAAASQPVHSAEMNHIAGQAANRRQRHRVRAQYRYDEFNPLMQAPSVRRDKCVTHAWTCAREQLCGPPSGL